MGSYKTSLGRYRKWPEWVDIVRDGRYNQYRDVINL